MPLDDLLHSKEIFKLILQSSELILQNLNLTSKMGLHGVDLMQGRWRGVNCMPLLLTPYPLNTLSI